jgi:hypothetical protein
MDNSRAQGNAALQESLMRRLTEDNAARLQRIGADVDPANPTSCTTWALATGRRCCGRRRIPLSDLLSPKIIDANPYMKGMTVGDFVSWARERMGQDRR